jgi:hypothetical protein
MLQGGINISPATGVIYQDHKGHSSTPEYVEGIEALGQNDEFLKGKIRKMRQEVRD